MRKSLFAVSLAILSITFAKAQNDGNKIIITQQRSTVPIGKVWKLERGTTTIVQLRKEVRQSGTMCNAMFLSNPGFLFAVNTGDYQSPKGYGIILESFDKVQYANESTYQITPTSFVDDSFKLEELANDKAENIGSDELSFYGGETVFVGNCLLTIEVTEYDMTKEELERENKKQHDITKEYERLKSNFNIPIMSGSNSESSSIPQLKDSLLNRILFSSKGVVHKMAGRGFALDDVTEWTMRLDTDRFDLESTGGVRQTYRVLDIKYNEALKMQEFQLGNSKKSPTHNLYIGWNPSSNRYMLLLNAIDGSEEYQFQNIQATVDQ